MTAPARLLDLTRLMSRLGKGPPTGVDRVEAAYLRHFLTLPDPIHGLIRSKSGFFLMDRAGLTRFNDLLANAAPLPPADLLSKLTRRHDPALARAETATRALSVARSIPPLLPRMLRRHLPQGFTYINTGHANLVDTTFQRLRQGGGTRIAVLIHDTIPLDHPQFTRPGIGAVFARKLAAVATHADLVIHSAAITRQHTERHFAQMGRVPPGVTAHLGIDPVIPASMPQRTAPYFVTIGTIEPRKNHAFLLDLWEQLHERLPEAEIPHLLILGRRGWSNAPVFARLDSLTFMNRTVFEMPGLPDDQVAGLLAGSAGLLFPSVVEGFGLPPLEAAALGTEVIVPPLPIYQETIGNYPVYADLHDSYSWLETIIRLTDAARVQELLGQKRGEAGTDAEILPTWANHFNTVLNLA